MYQNLDLEHMNFLKGANKMHIQIKQEVWWVRPLKYESSYFVKCKNDT